MSTLRQASFLTLLGCLVAAVAFIWLVPQPIVYDQTFIKTALEPLNSFPAFEDGVFSGLFARGLGLLLRPDAGNLNQLFRSISAILFVGATYPLLLLTTRKESTRVIAVLLLFGSRYPFLWLSSELLAGALLTLSITAFALKRPGLSGLLLASFALCKPDLILPAAGVAAAYLWLEKSGRLLLVSVFVGTLAAMNAPGVWLHGVAHFQGTRSWLAFAQHYSDLFAPHQFNPALSEEPFGNALRNVGASLPGASNLREMLLRYPMRYVDYFALSQVHFLKRLVAVFHLFLVAMLFLFVSREGRQVFTRKPLAPIALAGAASLIGLLPIMMITFVHARYLARYVPLLLCIFAGAVETRLPELTPRSRRVAYGLLGAAFFVQALLFVVGLYSVRNGVNFWMPD
jgi:hypothetical protein